MTYGTLIIADWEVNPGFISKLNNLGYEVFKVVKDKPFKSLGAKTNDDDEILIAKNGDKALKHFYKEGLKYEAKIVFLYHKRGYGELIASAHFYR